MKTMVNTLGGSDDNKVEKVVEYENLKNCIHTTTLVDK